MHSLHAFEVLMRSLSALAFFLLAAAVFAADDSNSAPTAPPKAAEKPVIDMYHGTKVPDNYRWLENGTSAETQTWVEQEMAYTRGILDRLPGRDAINKRLTDLLSIGSVSAPMIAGRHYFYTRREGMQNQPVLYVRDSLNGPDRVLVDANQLAADGTIALDWYYPSETGKYVAYGTSPSGSEMSTLHIIETKTGRILPDTIERTRSASVAWKLDNSGFYYTRYPQKGEVPEGQEMYNRHVYYHELSNDPEDHPEDSDQLIFGQGRDPEDWPNVSLSNDGRWLLISVEQGWTKSELFLMDVKAGTAATRITTGKNFLYTGEVYNDKLFITTNEDASRYRVFVADAGKYDREVWKELIPQSDAVLQGVSIFGGKLFAQYEQNAISQLKLFDLDGKHLNDIALPAIGNVYGSAGRWNRDELFYGFQSFTFAPSIFRYDLKNGDTSLWTKVDAPSVDPAAYEVEQEWFNSKDGTRVPMFVVHKKGLQKNGRNPT